MQHDMRSCGKFRWKSLPPLKEKYRFRSTRIFCEFMSNSPHCFSKKKIQIILFWHFPKWNFLVCQNILRNFFRVDFWFSQQTENISYSLSSCDRVIHHIRIFLPMHLQDRCAPCSNAVLAGLKSSKFFTPFVLRLFIQSPGIITGTLVVFLWASSGYKGSNSHLSPV